MSDDFLRSLPADCSELAIFEISLEDDPRQLLAESVLSKTFYDTTLQQEALAQADGVVPALKWGFFHELFEGPNKAYHIKDAKFAYLTRSGFSLLKHSWIWTSWEGGGHQVLVLRQPDGSLTSYAYSGDKAIFAGPAFFLQSQVPLILRAMDFSEHLSQRFWTVLARPVVELRDGEVVGRKNAGTLVRIEVRYQGEEKVKVGDREIVAEHIVVNYLREGEHPRPERILFGTAGVEEYWRQKRGRRQLVRFTTTFYGRALTMELLEESVVNLGAGSADGEPIVSGGRAIGNDSKCG